MSNKKDENVLTLAPPTPNPITKANSGLLPWNPRRSLTQLEQRIADESFTQRLTIDSIRIKALYGASKISELHQYTSSTFDGTVGFIIDIKDRNGRTHEHQSYIEQFSTRQIQLLGQHLMGTLEVSATSIGMEVDRSPYPPEPAPEPRGLLRRLFG